MPDANFFGKKTVFHEIITSTLLFYPLCLADILQKNCNFFFLIFIVFLYLPFHQKKQILLRIYLEYLGKKKNSNSKQSNKAKRKQPIRFISPALPLGLPYCYLFILRFSYI